MHTPAPPPPVVVRVASVFVLDWVRGSHQAVSVVHVLSIGYPQRQHDTTTTSTPHAHEASRRRRRRRRTKNFLEV